MSDLHEFPLVPVDQYSPGVGETPPLPFPHVESRERDAENAPEKGAELMKTSESDASNLTSSDKLSALPPPGSPHRPYYRSLENTSSPRPPFRRGLDGSPYLKRELNDSESSARSTPNVFYTSNSLPALESSFPSLKLNSSFNMASRSHPNQFNYHGRGPGSPPRGSTSESSLPRQRVSIESDRVSLSTMQGVRQALSRISRHSDPAGASPKPRRHVDSPMPSRPTSPNTSRAGSPSRTGSPLRILQQWYYRTHPREDPFVVVDPFQRRSSGVERPPQAEPAFTCEHGSTSCCLPLPCTSFCRTRSRMSTAAGNVRFHVMNTIPFFLRHTFPCEAYLLFLLQLPSWYFSRVARVFEDAEVSKPDIQRMIEATGVVEGPTRFGNISSTQPGHTFSPLHARTALASEGAHHGTHGPTVLPYPDDWTTTVPSLARFKRSWEEFIDSLVREWKQLNLISALLLTAIIALFQINSIDDDPLTRTAAFLALVSSLMSLSYGCMYIVRFGTMRSMWRASKWAEEARKTDASIWWNVWVLLAMPAIWLAWSMILFIISILSFLWRTGSSDTASPPDPLSPKFALGPRIAVTALLALGIFYFGLIVHTLKQYGTHDGVGSSRYIATRESDAARVIAVEAERRGRAYERSIPRKKKSSTRARRDGSRTTVGLGLMTPAVVQKSEVELSEKEQEDHPDEKSKGVKVEVKPVADTTTMKDAAI